MNKQKLVIFTVVILLAALPLSGLFGMFFDVNAANVTAYIDLTAQPGTAPSTIAAPPEVATSTADEFYISYVASSTQFAGANTITIQVPTSFTSLALCSSSTVDADGDTTNDGSLALSGTTFTYTFSQATTTATTTGVEICFAATTPSTPGNYSIAITDNNDTDTSAALIYVGDANDVTVSAVVPVSMALRIKNPSTTADINTCNLGVLNPASVNTCTYRVAGGTSHTAGMFIQIVADDYLNSGGNTIDDINTGVNTNIDAGVEEYGAYVSAAGTGFSINNSFNAYRAIPSTANAETPVTLLTATAAVNDSNTATWSTITHGASINTSTTGGTYDQVVTYRAFANI